MFQTALLPRLSPLTVRRPRLERWLVAYAQYPVRLVIAPAGCGKTSLLVQYARDAETDTLYCALPPGCEPGHLREVLSRVLESPRIPKSYAGLVEAVNGSPARCIQLIIDDVDNGTSETTSELLQLVEDVRKNVTLIYGARSREALDASRLIARGVAALCDARRLAFDVEEADMYAEACGAAHSDLDVRRLIEETDGWAMALCDTIRCAAADGETLARAYERWRAQSAPFLHEFVDTELERHSEEDRRAFSELLAGGSVDPYRLRRMEARGLFVFDDHGDLRVYRTLRQFGVKPKASAAVPIATPPLSAKLFRSFEAKIGGRDIPWVRRRDQQIVKYLLLKPNGTASRAELASVFWSETDRHLATQSVRTACSTIRKAFAAVVGYAAVDSYFRTTPDVQIDLGNAVCDVRRFSAHASDGDAAMERNDRGSAVMHYRAAEKLYAGRLLEFEAAEPWFAAQARLLEDRYVLVLERLSEMALEDGDHLLAREYALRANGIAPGQPAITSLLARLEAARRVQPSAPGAKPAPKRARSVAPAPELQSVS